MIAEIPDTYGAEEARHVIQLSMLDCNDKYEIPESLLLNK
jgi:hypothetical protein